jgi:deoxyhypusine synthase
MRKDKATIFLAFTSNMGTCGVREQIKYLTKNKMVDVLTTSVGAIEEDIIKCFKPFVLGDYRAPGGILREDGINRTGNIFIPNDRYIYFERFMNTFLERVYNMQKKSNKIIGIKEFVYELGKDLELQEVENKESSFTYWAYKNNLPFFCPALLDGSLGDMIYFFKKNNPEFKIDTSDYIVEVTDLGLNCEKMGIIAIGGGVPKHVVSNVGLFREGCEYCVYINTGLEMEGSNAGAPIDEAVSWGKIKSNAQRIKVEAEASIVFPLIVAGAFKLYFPEN